MKKKRGLAPVHHRNRAARGARFSLFLIHVCPSISPRRRPLRAPCCANPSRDRRPAASCPLPAPQTFSPPTSHGPTSPPGRDCVLPLLNLRVRGKPNTNGGAPGRCDRTTPHPHRTALAQCRYSQKIGSRAISPFCWQAGGQVLRKMSTARSRMFDDEIDSGFLHTPSIRCVKRSAPTSNPS